MPAEKYSFQVFILVLVFLIKNFLHFIFYVLIISIGTYNLRSILVRNTVRVKGSQMLINTF